MKKALVALVMITGFFQTICGESVRAQEIDNWTIKSFVVVKMNKQYEDAKRDAIEASRQLKLRIDLRGLSYNAEEGLSLSEAECDSNGWSYPTNYPRGRFDDGNYVSIEWSNAFDHLTKGNYIVVVSSGEKKKPSLRNMLDKSLKFFPGAFIANSKVYMGCVH
jgi:hypothetical protein